MAPLIALLVSFAMVWIVERIRGRADGAHLRAGRLALSAMFLVTGASHFFMADAMVAMLPPFVPRPMWVIWGTGVLEILGAIGLLVPGWRMRAGWCLAIFLVLVFPANVHAAFAHAGVGGHASGPVYLVFRAPLQLFFLVWTVTFGIRGVRTERSRAPESRAAGPGAGYPNEKRSWNFWTKGA